MRKFIRDGEVSTRPVRIQQLIDRAVRLVGGYVRERATLRIAPVPEALVAVAESLFLQVLANLLRNAANASPKGGAINLVVRATDTEITMVVTDDGAGVALDIADSMFEPFATNTVEGTGLGLAIAAYVMHMLGGRIQYRKDPTRGACFGAAAAGERGGAGVGGVSPGVRRRPAGRGGASRSSATTRWRARSAAVRSGAGAAAGSSR